MRGDDLVIPVGADEKEMPDVGMNDEMLDQVGIKLLDRSARDLPELAALWFQGARGGLIRALQSYLDDRVRRGLLRAYPESIASRSASRRRPTSASLRLRIWRIKV